MSHPGSKSTLRRRMWSQTFFVTWINGNGICQSKKPSSSEKTGLRTVLDNLLRTVFSISKEEGDLIDDPARRFRVLCYTRLLSAFERLEFMPAILVLQNERKVGIAWWLGSNDHVNLDHPIQAHPYWCIQGVESSSNRGWDSSSLSPIALWYWWIDVY